MHVGNILTNVGMLHTVGDILGTGGDVQYRGRNHEYCGGYLEYHGGYHDACGGYQEYHEGVQYRGGTQITKDFY